MDAPQVANPYLTHDLRMDSFQRLDNFPTPHVILIHDYNPNQVQTRTLVTAQLVSEAAKFTLKSLKQIDLSALQYFIGGLRAFLEPDRGPILGLGKMLGIAAMAIAPFLGFKAIVIGGGGAIVGAAATTVSAVACAGELAVKGVGRALEHTETARENLTRRFITRMEDAMKDMLPVDRKFYKDNMSYLINMAVLQVAFLSRGEVKDHLQVGGQPFSRQQVNALDITCQEYFNDIMGMKLAVQQIKEVMDEASNEKAWEVLKRDIVSFDETNTNSLPIKTHEAVLNIIVAMQDFSNKLNRDPIFARIMRNSTLA